MLAPISGSYDPQDCLFLLKPIKPQYLSIEQKEKLIQAGIHYSELIHREYPPSPAYLDLFLKLTAQYRQRLAAEIMRLAQMILQQRSAPYALVSLARAGTPIGVLLQRALRHIYQVESRHYSISIIRDRGIDRNALDYILARHGPENMVFIDGWTAKGAISLELKKSVQAYNAERGTRIKADLFVVSDIGGTAAGQASFEDYAIPSGLLNCTVSGLVSRSILNDQIGADDFHGCVFYQELAEYDLSRWFIDEISSAMSIHRIAPPPEQDQATIRQRSQKFLRWVQRQYHIQNIHHIKPGIAESTRVLLRRVPDLLLIRQMDHQDSLHLQRLAQEKSVPIVEYPKLPFGACALIKNMR